MYDDLIEKLRADEIPLDELVHTMREAVDVIKELSRRETPMKITEIHVDEYYCPACGAENNCDQGYVQDAYCPACGQRLLHEE